MMFSRNLLSAALTLGLPGLALAQPVTTELDDITVTATRTPSLISENVVPVQIIDRAQIDRSQAASLLDLLRGRAGLDFNNQGGAGKVTSLSVRGTASNQVLVLIDGVRIGAANSGMPALQDLPVDQIERIEIVRGPRSSLYGADAIGGVIQIFTRAAGKGQQQNLSLTAGSNQLRQASAGFSQRGERGWISAQGARQQTDGINACRGTAAGWGAGCFADEPDRDGYRNTSLNLRGGYTFTPALSLEAQLLDADAFNEYDGSLYGGNEADNHQQVYSGKLIWNPGDQLRLTTQLGRSRDEADSYFAEQGRRELASVFNTRRDSISVQADILVGNKQQLSAGLDWHDDVISGTPVFDTLERDNLAVFVEYQAGFGAHSLQASLRNDDNQQFGSHATGSLGYGFNFANGLRLTASAGTGFKAPTFNDLYYPGFSNPLLAPEESKSLNIGLAQYGNGWNWTANVYQTRIEQMIGYDTSFNIINIGRAQIRGAELTGFVSVAGWDINGELSYTDPRDDTTGATSRDKLLARRARSHARLDVDKALGAFRVGLTAAGSGHRYDDAANSVRLAGYGTLDLRVEYPISPAWTLQAKASNVFDRRYETIAWYNQPGREYQLSLRYRSVN